MPGNLWKVLLEAGDAVGAGDTAAIVESLKMEIRVTAPRANRVREILCRPGREVRAGQRLAVIEAAR